MSNRDDVGRGDRANPEAIPIWKVLILCVSVKNESLASHTDPGDLKNMSNFLNSKFILRYD